jgi:SAM-dependent methyltransferase
MLGFRELAADLARIDHEIGGGNRDIPRLFHEIPVDVFGKLLLDVPARYPHIRAHFPTMVSDEVQKTWTGAAGDTLLRQTVAFARCAIAAYHQFTDGRAETARILDFGCGYGRILRLMYKYFAAERIYAVDPWDKSIALCQEHGMKGNFAVSDWVPRILPFEGPFDFIYAFSVFTHLSERTAETCMAALRRVIAPSGLLAISIRPEEFWDFHDGGKYAAEMKARHAATGYAFRGFAWQQVNGENTYGDTSISLDYIRRKFPDWRIAGVDWNMGDYYQLIVFLQPAGR